MQRDARATERAWPRIRLIAILSGLMLIASGLLGPVAGANAQTNNAQTNSAYTVRDIQVTRTGSSGSAAKEAAIRDAHDEALAYLFRRLTPKSYHGSLPTLPSSKVDDMVVATDIQQEQITATAYTGTIALTFSPQAVRQELQARGIPFTDTVSPPLIIVPVYERAGALQLWETPNPWDSAWRKQVGAQGLVQTVMAEGTQAEQLIISADQALAGDATRLQALAQNYGARGALVAYVHFKIDPSKGQPVMEASLTGYGLAPPGPFSRTFVGNSGLAGGADQAAEELAEAAAAGLSEMLADAWKAQNLQTQSVGTDAILASARLTYLAEYANMVRQLTEIPAVAHFSLTRLSAKEALFRLQLRGGTASAKNVFSQYGLSLTETPDGWSLHSGG